MVNAYDPDGDFDVLVPETNEQLGEGTSGWAVDEADTTWGTGGTDKPDDKPDDPPKDRPDEPEDVMYTFPDLGGQFTDGGTVDGGFFGGHWNDGGNTDGNWGWGNSGGDEVDAGGWDDFFNDGNDLVTDPVAPVDPPKPDPQPVVPPEQPVVPPEQPVVPPAKPVVPRPDTTPDRINPVHVPTVSVTSMFHSGPDVEAVHDYVKMTDTMRDAVHDFEHSHAGVKTV